MGSFAFTYDIPRFVKLAALWERKAYYQTWYDKIIAPEVTDTEEKLNRVFRWIAEFPHVPEVLRASNVEQHEYYMLVKQYGTVSEKVRLFCALLTVAGYRAVPFNGEADGRVIVRIPSSKQNGERKWLKYRFDKKSIGDDVQGISLSLKVQEYLESVDTFAEKFLRPAYTRGELNIPTYRVLCKVQQYLRSDVRLIDHVTNQEPVEIAANC